MDTSPPSSVTTPSTLVDAVCALSDEQSRGFVFVRPNGTERFISFGDIGVEARRRGASLVARGLKKGDRVALVIPESDEFVLSFLGALFVGVVPVPLVPQLSFKNAENYHGTVAHVLRASGAGTLLTTEATRPFVEPALAQVESLRSILTVVELADGSSPEVEALVRPDDIAFLQFTSGSTSRPKGVVVTHANLAANSEAFMIHGLARDARTDVGVSWLPLFHDMGLIGFVVGPLFTGVACVFIPTASFVRTPRLWLDKIHQHRGTITYAPNFAYALVAKRLKDKDVEGLDLSSVRVAGCGAEPIQARSIRDFAAKLAPAGFDPRAFLASYGMAEATLAITFAPLGAGLRTDRVDPKSLANAVAAPSIADGATEIADCGRSFPGHELAIVDPSGRRLPERSVGEIVTRGPSVTAGYFDDAELTAQTFKPITGDAPGEAVWLFTGDLGYLADDRLFVCGRVKDIIIIRGRNYYPTDIEWAVGQIHTVRRGNVVAFGVCVDSEGRPGADGAGDEHLVVCCEGAGTDADAIRDAASACVSAQFGLTPHEVVVATLASLPRTSSGKPQRRKARQMYLEGTLPRARTVQGHEGEPGAVEP